MFNDIDRTLQAEQDRVSHLPSDKLPVMTAAAQTRLSWARTVDDFQSLPSIYHDYLTALLSGRSLPYAVLTPTFAGFMRREKEKLVFSLDDRLYVIERDGSQLKLTLYPLADLNYVEVGSILLKAWIRVSGRSSNGVLTSTVLKFNAVTDRLFAPFVQQIRAAVDPSAEVERAVELQKLDYLTTLNFKFRNFAYRSLQPGEGVIDSLLQPEMRRPVVTLFGRSLTRLVATTHLCILTDVELIIIRDDEDSPVWQSGTRHGGVWTFIPLDKIKALLLANERPDVFTLTIELPHDDRLESVFAPAQQREVERFLNQLLEWAPDATIKHEGRTR